MSPRENSQEYEWKILYENKYRYIYIYIYIVSQFKLSCELYNDESLYMGMTQNAIL